jgi:hypothetical protein
MGTDPEIWNRYGEPTRGQTGAPVPNFERFTQSMIHIGDLSHTHSTISTDMEKIQRHKADLQSQNRFTDKGQFTDTEPNFHQDQRSRSATDLTQRSHKEAQEENFAKSTIHIGDLSQIQGDPGPWEQI